MFGVGVLNKVYGKTGPVLSSTHLPLHSLNLISGCFFRASCRDIPRNAPFVFTPSLGVGGGCSHYVFDTRAITVFAPSNEYS